MATDFLDIIPVVPYEDIRAAHDFLVDVLGFGSGGVIEDGDGNVVHGEVRAGGRRIWLHALAEPDSAGVVRPSLMNAATSSAHSPRF